MMLRSFIAVEIPAEMQAAIARSTLSLQKTFPKPVVRWVALQNVHLTLKFLGDVAPANLEQLADALKVETSLHEPFTMSAGGLGAFPSPRRARILWIGLEAPAALTTLSRRVEYVAAQMGYSSEDRPFSPHLTIGRVGQNLSPADQQRLRAALEGTTIGVLGVVRVQAVHIFRSTLQPGGSLYTHLYSLPMRSTAG